MKNLSRYSTLSLTVLLIPLLLGFHYSAQAAMQLGLTRFKQTNPAPILAEVALNTGATLKALTDDINNAVLVGNTPPNSEPSIYKKLALTGKGKDKAPHLYATGLYNAKKQVTPPKPSGTWSSATNVLVADTDDHTVAAHTPVFAGSSPSANSGAISTGFSANSGLAVPIPAASLFVGPALLGLGFITRRKKLISAGEPVLRRRFVRDNMMA